MMIFGNGWYEWIRDSDGMDGWIREYIDKIVYDEDDTIMYDSMMNGMI